MAKEILINPQDQLHILVDVIGPVDKDAHPALTPLKLYKIEKDKKTGHIRVSSEPEGAEIDPEEFKKRVGEVGESLKVNTISDVAADPRLLRACEIVGRKIVHIKKGNSLYALMDAVSLASDPDSGVPAHSFTSLANYKFKRDNKGGVVVVDATSGNEVDREDFYEAVDGLKDELLDPDQTDIFAAATNGNIALLRACMIAGRSVVDERDDIDDTPLHCATTKDVAEFLVKNGADIFAVDGSRKTALVTTVGTAQEFLTQKHEEFAKHHYAELAPKASTPELKNRRNEILKMFHGFVGRDESEYKINEVTTGQFEIVGSDGAPLKDWQVGYALNEWAKVEIFKRVTAGSADKEFLDTCIDLGVSVDEKGSDGNPLLHYAAYYGNGVACEYLIKNGANISSKNSRGEDALRLAAQQGKKDVCKILVDNGADFMTTDSAGKSAIAYATSDAGEVFVERIGRNKSRYEDLAKSETRKKALAAFHNFLVYGNEAKNESEFTSCHGVKYKIKKTADDFEIVGFDDDDDELVLEPWEIGFAMESFAYSRKPHGDEKAQDFIMAAVLAELEGDSETVEICLQLNPALKNYRDSAGRTLLYHAGSEDVAKLLALAGGKVKIDPKKRASILQTFLDNQDTWSLGEKGAYLIEKDGDDFSVSVMRGRSKIKLEDAELDHALNDIGRTLIRKAAQSNDAELFQTCLDAGVQWYMADTKGKTPLAAAKNSDSQEVVDVIKSKRDESFGKFRELAKLVKDGVLAGKDDTEINKTIEAFRASNPDLKLDGLKAADLRAFMNGMMLMGHDGQPSVGKTANQDVKNAVGIDIATPPDDLDKIFFHRELMFSCLEDQLFFSRNLDQTLKGHLEETAKVAADGTVRDKGEKALRTIGHPQDSVIGIYCRAKFSQLKTLEGLPAELTYEEFAQKLGEVVKITSGVDLERKEKDIAARAKELEKLEAEHEAAKKKIDDNPNTPAKDRIDYAKKGAIIASKGEALEVLREEHKKDKEKEDTQHLRAINALLSTGETPHRDLRIALDMIRSGMEVTPQQVVQTIEKEEAEAAKAIHRIQRGFHARHNKLDLGEHERAKVDAGELLKTNLQKSETDFSVDDDYKLKPEQFRDNYGQGQIEEIKGQRIYSGNTGCIIHEFDGFEGLREFNNQVERATHGGRLVPKDADAEVSIALIRRGGSLKEDIYCIATNEHQGTTRTFVSDIDAITERSEEIYKRNLEFLTKRAGIEAAISVLTEARGEHLPGAFTQEPRNSSLSGLFNAEEDYKKIRDDFSAQLRELRKCLIDSQPDEKDTPEQREKKIAEFSERLKEFKDTEEGKKFFKLLKEGVDERLIIGQVNEKLEKVSQLLEHDHSTEELREDARRQSSRQLNKELSAQAKAAVKENQARNNLDPDEKDRLVAKYQSSNLSSYFTTDPNYSLRKGSAFRTSEKDLRDLLSTEIPTPTAPNSISILRPKGHDAGHVSKSIATVVFNGNPSDDTAYLALPGSSGCYIRVSRFDGENGSTMPDVYRNGTKVNEVHNRGDVVIDTGVVFHKNPDGTYEAVKLDDVKKKYGKSAYEAALDFRVKAISIDENGDRQSTAILYAGQSVDMELKPKTSYHGKETAGKSEDYSMIFRHEGGVIVSDEEKNKKVVVAEAENFKLLINFHAEVKDGRLYMGGDTSEHSRGVIEYVDPITKETKAISLRNNFGAIDEEAAKTLTSLLQAQGKEKSTEFLMKLFNGKLSEYEVEELLDRPTNQFELARKIADHCDEIKVGAGLQEVRKIATKGGEPIYENVGSVVTQTYKVNRPLRREEEITSPLQQAKQETASLIDALRQSLRGEDKRPGPNAKKPVGASMEPFLLSENLDIPRLLPRLDTGTPFPPAPPTGKGGRG